ncbi:MAG: hypothetical protein FWH20_08915 [Oscillospiraceae bacterium]|nr:hypothetical protein [Oscillospiraceae bacterium]
MQKVSWTLWGAEGGSRGSAGAVDRQPATQTYHLLLPRPETYFLTIYGFDVV